MLDKINELETIMLGAETNDPKFAWLKEKFDALREESFTPNRTHLITAFALIAFGNLGLGIWIGWLVFG